jgi:iron complex outermembrane receptor protein
MRNILSTLVASTALAAPVLAQEATLPAPAPAEADSGDRIIVTGSRIKRQIADSPVPISVFTQEDLLKEGISSPEQFVSFLTSNGNGLDNLASNADVVSGQARGNNGASSANLRNQGSSATLILLNGRRVPAHGLNGGIVDINQIPQFAVERIEVLKDGASAIYGTDAVGGVINYITRKELHGLRANGFMDMTQQGGGDIFSASVLGGVGKLEERGFNIMGGVSWRRNNALRGDQRDFVNTFQPERGLSPDTRGSPHATIFPLGTGPNTPSGTIINAAGTAPIIPGLFTPTGQPVRAGAGINVLDLPGQAGCGAIDGQGPYDELLWDLPGAAYACAWDTGRAAVLQQPIETITYFGRASAQFGRHEAYAEVSGSTADSAKRFSNVQITPNTTTQNYGYPRTAANAATYDRVFNALVAAFPTDTLLASRRGLPISFRWRCIECGPREIETETDTLRVSSGLEGPVANWEYRLGFSWGYSESQSTLGKGYYYRGTDAAGRPISQPGIITALNSGALNPFLFPGETQSAAGLAALEAASAEGVVLYGGRYTLWQVDGSVAGRLFSLPAGDVETAIGVDWRREEYAFNGDQREAAARPVIVAAPFDDANALTGVKRDIIAAYAEFLVPITRTIELNGAVRVDEYDGFGRTTNPKVSARWQPISEIAFRASFNTSFRVPSFNQIFNGTIESLYSGRDLADPAKCPGGRPDTAIPGCEFVAPFILNGGNPNLGPESARMYSAGVVITPSNRLFLSVDWWLINRSDRHEVLTLRQLVDNFDLFPERFLRNAAGNLVTIDQRWINSGQTYTSGIEINGRANGPLWGGDWSASLDGTYLIEKVSRLTPNSPLGVSEVGVFSFGGDLGLRWKHNIVLGWSSGPFSASFTQIFRLGYTNQQLPGVASRRIVPPELEVETDNYVVYNFSASYRLWERVTVTGGVRNLFNSDPPFAIAYDSNTGAGSSWEPRVADPRGRSFTLSVGLAL